MKVKGKLGDLPQEKVAEFVELKLI